MAASDAVEPIWGRTLVDPESQDLPGLKFKFLLERLPDRGRVLEIGCGEGKILRSIAPFKPHLELHGSDVREPRSDAQGFTFHRSLTAPALAEHSFDVILIVDVLEHVPDPKQLLIEARRLLRPSGKLLAFVPVEGERLSFYSLFRWLLGQDTFAVTKDHVQSFTHSELIRLVSESFEVLEVRYAYHALGQLMDASFFAATRLRSLRSFWWNDNSYYNPPRAQMSWSSRVLNGLLQLGNRIAWSESTLLAGVRLGAAGVLLTAAEFPRAAR